MPKEEELEEDLDEEEDDDEDDEDDDESDDEDDAVETVEKMDVLEDIAEHLGDVYQEAAEVDLNDEQEAVFLTMNDGSKWKLTLRRVV